MPTDSDDIDATSRPVKGKKLAGKLKLLTLSDLDQRTTAAADVRAAIEELTSDLGHAPSAAERALIQRCAVLDALLTHSETAWISGGAIDATSYSTLCNTLRRLLESLGIKRSLRDVSPVPTLAQIAEELAREANNDKQSET